MRSLIIVIVRYIEIWQTNCTFIMCFFICYVDFMDYLTYKYVWKSRDFRKVVLALLKSWLVDEIQKMNYIHNYTLKNGKIDKWDIQLFMIHSIDQQKVDDFLSRNFPQIERICLK